MNLVSKNEIDSSSSKDEKAYDNFKSHLDNFYFLMDNIYLRKFKRVLLIISLLVCYLLSYFLEIYIDDIIIIYENTFLNKDDMNHYQDLYLFYNLLLKDVKSMKILNRRNYPFIKSKKIK